MNTCTFTFTQNNRELPSDPQFFIPHAKSIIQKEESSRLEREKLKTNEVQVSEQFGEAMPLEERPSNYINWERPIWVQNVEHEIRKKCKLDNGKKWGENPLGPRNLVSIDGPLIGFDDVETNLEMNSFKPKCQEIISNQPIRQEINPCDVTNLNVVGNSRKPIESLQTLEAITDSLCENAVPIFDFAKLHQQYCLSQTFISQHGSLEAYLHYQQKKFDNFMEKMQDILQICTNFPAGDIEPEEPESNSAGSNFRPPQINNPKKTKKTKKTKRNMIRNPK